MIQPRTLDDFKDKKIPYYYKAAQPKKIPLAVYNQKIIEHVKTAWYFKLLGFFLSVYSYFSFFNYLKYSRFLEISEVNFQAERKIKIQNLILENNLWIDNLLKEKSDFFKSLDFKEAQYNLWKNQTWFDFFWIYNPNLNPWQDNFLIFYTPKESIIRTIYNSVDFLDLLLSNINSIESWKKGKISEYLGYYTPPTQFLEKILTEEEIKAEIAFKKLQETRFSNSNCEIRSYLIEYLFKNKVTLDFLDWRKQFIKIDWCQFEINYLNFKFSKDVFCTFSLTLEKDLLKKIYFFLIDFFLIVFELFNIFFYCTFIFVIFLVTLFIIIIFYIITKYKRFSYKLFLIIFDFFYAIWLFLSPFWRSFKKYLRHNLLIFELKYFFPFENKTRKFFKLLKNKYEFFFKNPFLTKLNNFANFLNDCIGLHNFKLFNTLSQELIYLSTKHILLNFFGLAIEFILAIWLYNLQIDVIITNHHLARFLYWWPEVAQTTAIERLCFFGFLVVYSKFYSFYRFERLDQCLFVLETKQNNFQAQAIDQDRPWVFFSLHDYDPVPGEYERYYRVCRGDEHRIPVPIIHWSHVRYYEISTSKNIFFRFFKWKFW